MSVTDVCNAEGAPSAESPRGEHRKYRIPLNVTVDDADDCGAVVVDYLHANGYPMYSAYSQPNYSDPASVVQRITATRKGGSLFEWSAVVEYGGHETEQVGNDPDGNPTTDPEAWLWDIDVRTVPVQVPVWNAKNVDTFPRAGAGCAYKRDPGVVGPVVNSAGTPLDPPLMRDIYDTVYTIGGNALVHKKAWVDDVVGFASQSDMKFSDVLVAYYGMDATAVLTDYTVLCTAAAASFVSSNTVRYWSYQYEFRVRPINAGHVAYEPDQTPNGWYRQTLDQGVQRFAYHNCPDGKGGTYDESQFPPGIPNTVPVIGPDQKRVRENVLLNGEGQPHVAISPTLPANPKGYWFEWEVEGRREMIGNQAFALDIFKAST